MKIRGVIVDNATIMPQNLERSNIFKNCFNFLWQKRYPHQIACATILPQNLDWSILLKTALAFCGKKGIPSNQS